MNILKSNNPSLRQRQIPLMWAALAVLVVLFSSPAWGTAIPGCQTNTVKTYSTGFDATEFDMINVSVDDARNLSLDTGNQAINPNSIIIPFEQEVWVSFLHENAGYRSSLGWVRKEDALDTNGNFLGWNNIPASKKQRVFRSISDGSQGGDGILDVVASLSEIGLTTYDDGTGSTFVVDGDGQLTPKDMRKSLGRFAAGEELVFFLAADRDFDTTESDRVFFTKKDWNPDTFTSCSTYSRSFNLGAASSGDCATISKGWMDTAAIERLSDNFTLTMSGTYPHSVTPDARFDHVIVGAPANDPNQWILGWEDIFGGGDMDFNDTSFRIERKTGGTARLSPNQAISPSTEGSYFTGVTLEVYDRTPAGSCLGKTDITYFVSIDNGDTWVEITDWDKIHPYTLNNDGSKTLGDEVASWSSGDPEFSYKSASVDFAALDQVGRELTWKAEMTSEEEECIPKILDVSLDGRVVSHSSFSRASPVSMANVLYSGSYETPALTWVEKKPRGHLRAVRLYDPTDTSTASSQDIWDAGARLAATSPSSRTIYTPDMTISQEIGETLTLTKPDGNEITVGDGITTTFTGRLAHNPALATTVVISADGKSFYDAHNGTLKSNWGSGSIKRFTGEFEITFDSPPPPNVPITASYSHYTTAGRQVFNTTNINKETLALDNSELGGRLLFDLDKDGDFDENDADWLVEWVRGFRNGNEANPVQKEWKLGPVDHSVPALMTPPGKPQWYFGTDVTTQERESFDAYIQAKQDRKAVLFVGSRSGMLHAFYAGKFRWGDNPKTNVKENRGFFLWEDDAGIPTGSPNYGTGDELWSFIPANLLPRLKNNLLLAEDQAFVDASPALADVYVNGAWRSVVLAAQGNGGDTVLCLDVTNPDDPQFMWEYADTELFRSRSSPSIGQIGQLMINGTAKWAAFFVSGKTHDSSLYPSIYIIDIADGSLIRRVYLDSDTDGIGGVPSGQPAIVDSDGNGYIDRIYMGTDKGRLYKVTLSDDPANLWHQVDDCVVNTDMTDNATGSTVSADQQWHPMYASPTVVVDNGLTSSGELDYNIRIFFGTGDSPYFDENINIGNTTYHFFAYNDKAGKGVCTSNSVELDWFYALPAGQRVFASAFAAAGQIYFGTSSAETENLCDGSNTGKLYGFHIKGYNGNSPPNPIMSQDTGDISTSPYVADEHLYVKTPTGTVQVGGGGFNNKTTVGGIGKASTKSWKALDD